MAEYFPENPSVGDTVTSYDGTWIWDGVRWRFHPDVSREVFVYKPAPPRRYIPPWINLDRHVRRDCEDYGEAFLQLLPQGQAWPREEGSTLVRVCRGLACYWGTVDERAADLLVRESDPRTTVELLPDWERAWGLPDPCFPEALTIAERQKMLVLYMTYLGGQSREYFEKLMDWLGIKIQIKEFAPFMAGISRVGDTRERARVRWRWDGNEWVETPGNGNMVWRPNPDYNSSDPDSSPGEWEFDSDLADNEYEDNFRWYIGPPEMRFFWSANVGSPKLTWFRAASGQSGVDHHLHIGIAEDLQCLLNRWKPAHTGIVLDYSQMAFAGPMQGTP